MATCPLSFLVSVPPPEPEMELDPVAIVNKDVEARIGQLVQATPEYIMERRHLGLEDTSATNARDAFDGQRLHALERQAATT